MGELAWGCFPCGVALDVLGGNFRTFCAENRTLVADGVPCGFARALGVIGGFADALGVLGGNAMAILIDLPVATALGDITAFDLTVALGVFAFVVDEACAALIALLVLAAGGVQALKRRALGGPCGVGFTLIGPCGVGFTLVVPLKLATAFGGEEGLAGFVAVVGALGGGGGLVLKAQTIGFCLGRGCVEGQERKCGEQSLEHFSHRKLLGR